MSRSMIPGLAFAAVLVVSSGAGARAHAAPAESVQQAQADTAVAAIVARSEEAIKADLQAANTALAHAERQRPEAQAAVSTAKARLEIRKKEIELVGKQIDLANQQKNEAEKARYERDKAALEWRKKLVEAEIEMAEAHVQVFEARRDLARDEIQALERELELGIAQADLDDSVQRKLLESLDKVGGRREELGKREKTLVEKQRKVLDAGKGRSTAPSP